MPRTVLIVDDNTINRQILSKILSADYTVWEAGNGARAMEILAENDQLISAVLLDIVMPVMDGYQMLELMQRDPALAQIPVIVTTGSSDLETEKKALSLGANDFVPKPFDADIIKHRLTNLIRLRETAAMVNTLQRDELTGLLVRKMFFISAEEKISRHEPGYYVMASFDVDNFKVINDQYGTEKGDVVLRMLAEIFEEGFAPVGGICCRVMADNFAVLYPRSFMGSEEIAEIRRKASQLDGSIQPLLFSVGRYIVEDLSLPVSGMYDRAVLAQVSVKGRYDSNVGLYNESMRTYLLKEQAVTSGMKAALDAGEFEVWFQPQYNHSSGALIGAEALVRWRQPERGLIPPGEFIPIFERNGFVYELDKYVWEQTCAYLRRWLDEGRLPLPVSVNISRYDVFRDDIIEVLTGLIKKYSIPVGLLRLEITESAFSRSTERIIAVVKQLIGCGFTMEIDDFGSGYSSLNTLKDVPAQVVKLDMRFLDNNGDNNRGGNIIESVVRMVKWLGMSLIAEGVETAEQADYLNSIGCSYVQGYLYAKPMPAGEYEALEGCRSKEKTLAAMEALDKLDNNKFWDPNSMDTLIFNSYVGGACIFEYHSGKLELLRVNEKYTRELGEEGLSVEEALHLDLAEYMDGESVEVLRRSIRRAAESGEEAVCEVRLDGLGGKPGLTYLRTALRVIASVERRHLIYCSIRNVTFQRVAEQKERRAAQRLETIMANASGGICAAVFSPDGLHSDNIIFANDRYYAIYGYTREQFSAEIGVTYELVHPDDRAGVEKKMKKLARTRKTDSYGYRCVRRDGSVAYLHVNASIIRLDGVDSDVFLTVTTDVTELAGANERLRESDEQLRFLNDMARDLLAQPRVRDGIEGVLNKIMHHFAGSRAYIFEFDRERDVASNTFEVCAPGVSREIDNLQDVPLSSFSVWRDAFEGRDYISIEDVDALDESRAVERNILAMQGIHSLVSVPLHRDGVLIGFVGVDDPSRGMDHVGRLIALGDYLTVMLTRRDLTAKIENDENALRGLMNDTPGGFARVQLHSDGSITTDYVNEPFCRMRGMSFDEVMAADGADAMSSVHPDDVERVRAVVMNMLASKEVGNVEYRLRCAGGKYTAFNVFGRITRSDSGDNFINAYYTEACGQKMEEPFQRESLELLRLLTNGVPVGLATYAFSERGLRIIYFNDSLCEMMGYTREEYAELTKSSVITAVLEQDLPLLKAQIEALTRDGVPINCTYRVRDPKGGCKWVNLRASFEEWHVGERRVNAALFDVSEQKLAEEAARVHEKECSLAIERGGRLMYRYSHADRSVEMPENTALLFGSPTHMSNVPESMISSGAIAPESTEAYTDFYEAIRRGESTGSGTIRRRIAGGVWRWFEVHFSTVCDDEGVPVSAIIVFEDITDRVEEQTKEEFDRSRYLAALGIMYPLLISVNLTQDFYQVITGGEHFDYLGAPEGSIAELIRTSAESIEPEYAEKLKRIFSPASIAQNFPGTGSSLRMEYRQRPLGRTPHWVELVAIRVENKLNSDIIGVVVCRFTDAQKAIEQKLKQAELDGMTGIYNKTATEKLIAGRLMEEGVSACAMIVADLDDLKGINDTLGHHEGDRAIKLMAKLLRTQFRQTDIVGRVGGDEFAVFLCNMTEAQVRGAMATFMRRLSTGRVGENNDRQIHSSVGIAMGGPEDSYETLFRKADRVLYHVKRNGKDDFAFYSSDMEEDSYQYREKNAGFRWQSGFYSSEELEHLLEAISSVCPTVISVNLTQNSYYMLRQGSRESERSPRCGVYDELVSARAGAFGPEDRDAFLETLSRKGLLEAYERGEPSVSFEGRERMSDGKYRHILAEVVFIRRDGDILEITLAREIKS